jgi:hypothetical protein
MTTIDLIDNAIHTLEKVAHDLTALHNLRATDLDAEAFEAKLKGGAPRDSLEWMTDTATRLAEVDATIAILRKGVSYRPIETAPVDECVILATTGGCVGEAVYGENAEDPTWRWIHADQPLHPNLKPLGWMPLPPEIETPAT